MSFNLSYVRNRFISGASTALNHVVRKVLPNGGGATPGISAALPFESANGLENMLDVINENVRDEQKCESIGYLLAMKSTENERNLVETTPSSLSQMPDEPYEEEITCVPVQVSGNSYQNDGNGQLVRNVDIILESQKKLLENVESFMARSFLEQEEERMQRIQPQAGELEVITDHLTHLKQFHDGNKRRNSLLPQTKSKIHETILNIRRKIGSTYSFIENQNNRQSAAFYQTRSGSEDKGGVTVGGTTKAPPSKHAHHHHSHPHPPPSSGGGVPLRRRPMKVSRLPEGADPFLAELKRRDETTKQQRIEAEMVGKKRKSLANEDAFQDLETRLLVRKHLKHFLRADQVADLNRKLDSEQQPPPAQATPTQATPAQATPAQTTLTQALSSQATPTLTTATPVKTSQSQPHLPAQKLDGADPSKPENIYVPTDVQKETPATPVTTKQAPPPSQQSPKKASFTSSVESLEGDLAASRAASSTLSKRVKRKIFVKPKVPSNTEQALDSLRKYAAEVKAKHTGATAKSSDKMVNMDEKFIKDVDSVVTGGRSLPSRAGNAQKTTTAKLMEVNKGVFEDLEKTLKTVKILKKVPDNTKNADGRVRHRSSSGTKRSLSGRIIRRAFNLRDNDDDDQPSKKKMSTVSSVGDGNSVNGTSYRVLDCSQSKTEATYLIHQDNSSSRQIRDVHSTSTKKNVLRVSSDETKLAQKIRDILSTNSVVDGKRRQTDAADYNSNNKFIKLVRSRLRQSTNTTNSTNQQK